MVVFMNEFSGNQWVIMVKYEGEEEPDAYWASSSDVTNNGDGTGTIQTFDGPVGITLVASTRTWTDRAALGGVQPITTEADCRKALADLNRRYPNYTFILSCAYAGFTNGLQVPTQSPAIYSIWFIPHQVPVLSEGQKEPKRNVYSGNFARAAQYLYWELGPGTDPE